MVWFWICAALPLFGQPAVDTRAIVRRAVQAEASNWQAARTYGYAERVGLSHLDSQGKPKSNEVKTYHVTLPDGSPYRRLAARADRPLTPAEEKKEQANLARQTAGRHAESPAERTERVAAYGLRPTWLRKAWQELPEAFDYRLVAAEALRGRPMFVLDTAPRPGRTVRSGMAKILSRIHGRLWVDQQTSYLAKAEIEVDSAIWMGFFLLRVGPGSRASFEHVLVDGKVWLPARIQALALARLGLVKALAFEQITGFSDYRELPESSPIILRALAR